MLVVMALPTVADSIADPITVGPSPSSVSAVTAPSRLRFDHSTACGDRVCVDSMMRATSLQTTLRNGEPDATVADLSTHRYRYREKILGMGPSGRVTAVRRAYEVARHTSMHDGRAGTARPWDLEGKTVVVSDHAGIATISGISSPRGDEASVLETALTDDISELVLFGDRAVGEEWNLPGLLTSSPMGNATCRGKARFDGYAVAGGLRCAQISFTAVVVNTDSTGRRITLDINGSTYWSPQLMRTVACTYEGATKTVFDTQQGADVVQVTSTGTIKLSRTMTWLEIDGNRVTRR